MSDVCSTSKDKILKLNHLMRGDEVSTCVRVVYNSANQCIGEWDLCKSV